MAYSEIHCRLCGVSFNIGRMRLENELRSASWSAFGGYKGCVGNSIGEQRQAATENGRSWRGESCTELDGCRVIKREICPSSWKDIGGETCIALNEYNEDEDLDLSDGVEDAEGAEANELYEYESNDDLLESSDTPSDPMVLDLLDELQNSKVGNTEESIHWARYLRGERISEIDILAKGEIFLPLTTKPSRKDEERKADRTQPYVHCIWEHIPGLHCKDTRGYSGYYISAQEMLGCNTAQSLRPKPHMSCPPTTDPYDQDYEHKSKVFLTGLTDKVPCRQDNWPKFIPIRLGATEVTTDDILWDWNSGCGMPFHPTCFDIFTRLSKMHLGFVDLNGLYGWYCVESSYEDVKVSQRRNSDVDTGCSFSDAGWQHLHGGEYLAANPLFVPSLRPILQSAIYPEATFNSSQDAFPAANIDLQSATTSRDRLYALPLELKLEIISHLHSRDIANLRLATPAYRQIPIFFWRKLLRREMPWLWEVWSADEPYPWALISTADRFTKAQEAKDARNNEISERRDLYREVLKEEMPEILDTEEWAAAEGYFEAQKSTSDPFLICQSETREGLLYTLPAENTNWYEVYTGITRHWNDLKGLKNRQRIWRDVGEIVTQIQQYRLEGKVQD